MAALLTYLPDNVKSFHKAFANSVIVASSVTFLTLLFGSLSAYTVARLRFRWAAWLMNLNVVARFVPIIVPMIPLYVTFRNFGMLNSLARAPHPAYPQLTRRVHDPAGRDREPSGRRPRLLQPDDAICLLAMLPSVILVLLLQKFVVQGLQVGGVKG